MNNAINAVANILFTVTLGALVARVTRIERGATRRVFFTAFGRDYEFASFRGGNIEVYEIEDGLAIFKGYLAEYNPNRESDMRSLFGLVWTKAQPSAAARETWIQSVLANSPEVVRD